MPNVVGCRVVKTAGEYCAKKDDAAKPNVVGCRVVETAGEYCAKKTMLQSQTLSIVALS